MTIKALRSRARPDNLKNQVRAAGSTFGRKLYLASVAGGASYIVLQLVGPLLFVDADGLVLRERQVVAPSFQATVIATNVRPGDHVAVGQEIAVVQSSQMLDLIMELANRKSQFTARLTQIRLRQKAISTLMPAARAREQQMSQMMEQVHDLVQRKLVTMQRQGDIAKDYYDAQRELAQLIAEAATLDNESATIEVSRNDVQLALDQAQKTYNGGRVVAEVEGTVGPKTASSGTTVRPGDAIVEIHRGASFVVAYVPTDRLYSVKPGDQVVVTDGGTRRKARIERIESLADAVPAEFQSNFRSVDRQQMLRVVFDGESPFPILSKVKVTTTFTPVDFAALARASFVMVTGMPDALFSLVANATAKDAETTR